MVSDRDMIRAFMARLVDKAGGVDATEGKFPARWYRGIRDLCLAASCPCPDEVFNFIVPVQPSGDARDVA